jgi:ferrous iron transport protein B
MASCHAERAGAPDGCALTIALVCNANVGKSAIYNQLTGSEQAVGNWSGKTVDVAAGVLRHHGKLVRVVDLPGTYSLSSGAGEESVTREYLLAERPDIVVNVVDSTALERNLYLTIQLAEMGVGFVVAANMTDAASAKGIAIDADELAKRLGVPVVKVSATSGVGVHELVDAAMEAAQNPRAPVTPRYGKEVEERVSRLAGLLTDFPAREARWAATKLMEGGEVFSPIPDSTKVLASEMASELEKIHGESPSVIMSSERYSLAAKIAADASMLTPGKKSGFADVFDSSIMHGVWGYFWLFAIMVLIIATVSVTGDWIATSLASLFE